MTTELLVLILVALGILAGLVLLAVLLRRPGGLGAEGAANGRAMSLGMSLGMLFGAALGVIVWVSTGQFVFWVIFLGAGMTVGMAAGLGWQARRR